MNNNIHRFSVSVNCNLPGKNITTDELQDFKQFYEDNGFIIFPNTYTEYGDATRLVINCHGAGERLQQMILKFNTRL